MINPEKHIFTYATFSDFAGEKAEVDFIIEKIRSLNLGGILIILSQMTSSNKSLKKSTGDIFRKVNKAVGNSELLKYIEDKELYSDQGLFYVWKWLLAYGDQNKMSESEDIMIGVNQIIHLCILLSDYLEDSVDEESVIYSIFSNSTFNSNNDLGSDFARASLMFSEIASDPSLFEEKEYIDLSGQFLERYGYTLQDYFSAILGLIAGFKISNEINPTWNKSLNLFENTHLSDIGQSIVRELSFSLTEGEEWAADCLNDPWDYSRFRSKPLLLLDNQNFYPISTKLLYDAIFSELYFKIRHVFPSDSTQVISFFGRVFEKYVEKITMEAVMKKVQHGLNYQLIEEFKFKHKHKGEKKSPDVLIRLGDTLFAVEAKVFRLKMDSMFGVKRTVDEDTQRMVVKPIKQLNERLEQIAAINHPSIDGVKEIYLMSVTWGHFPSLSPFEEKIQSSMPDFNLPVKGHFHLDIEEYEMLMELISRKNARPIFHYLDNKTRLAPNMPFKNFLFDSNLRPRRMTYLTEKLRDELNRCRDHLYKDRTQ